MSESLSHRLAQYQTAFVSHIAAFNEQWMLYAGGKPVSLNVKFSAHLLPDQRMAMLCEAPAAAVEEPASVRSVEALLHTAAGVTNAAPPAA